MVEIKRGFYVSVRAHGQLVHLVGPVASESEARDLIPAARAKCREYDPEASMYWYGVTVIEESEAVLVLPQGRFNALFPASIAVEWARVPVRAATSVATEVRS